MSKEYQTLKEETGETAFLAGVVDVLADTLSLACDSVYAFAADIFQIPGNHLTMLDDAVQKRLRAYQQYEKNIYVNQEEIDCIHFKLERVEEDVAEYVYQSFLNYSSSKDLKKAVEEFFCELNWYLQKPVCIYRPVSQCSKKVLSILGYNYLYIAFDYFFIAYDEYMVLVLFGTTE